MSILIFAQLQTLRSNIFSTKALLVFWVIPNWFSKFSNQLGYLNSKIMLRWDDIPLSTEKTGMLCLQKTLYWVWPSFQRCAQSKIEWVTSWWYKVASIHIQKCHELSWHKNMADQAYRHAWQFQKCQKTSQCTSDTLKQFCKKCVVIDQGRNIIKI